jgi:hypothetical protein
MKSAAKWHEIAPNCTLVEFAQKNNLDIQRLRSLSGVVVLPSLPSMGEKLEGHLFSPEAKEVLFILRESGVEADFYQDARDRRELILKDDSVILPTLCFLADAVSKVSLDVLSAWIFEKFVKNRHPEPPATIKYEHAEIRPDGSILWRRIEGPADQVSKVLLKEAKHPGGKTVVDQSAPPSIFPNIVKNGKQIKKLGPK